MGDLICRQAAIDALNEYFDRIGKLKRRGLTKGEKAISLDTVGTIKTLPSAEPKTGEWVMLERDENVHDICGVQTWGVNYMCDKCGFITTAIQDHFSQYKFCPSCGARMKGGEEE